MAAGQPQEEMLCHQGKGPLPLCLVASARCKQNQQFPAQNYTRAQTPLSKPNLNLGLCHHGPSRSCPDPLLWAPCPPLDHQASGYHLISRSRALTLPEHSFLPQQNQYPTHEQTSNNNHCSQPFTHLFTLFIMFNPHSNPLDT